METDLLWIELILVFLSPYLTWQMLARPLLWTEIGLKSENIVGITPFLVCVTRDFVVLDKFRLIKDVFERVW